MGVKLVEIMHKKTQLIGLIRDSDHKIQPLFSDDSHFMSERQGSWDAEILINTNFEPDGVATCWEKRKRMVNVPLAVSEDLIRRVRYTEDYNHLPGDLKHIFMRDLLRTTSSNARSNYSVLMPSTSSDLYPEGRTGVLLCRGEPVIVNIKGKEFIVEIKGVGSPDGNNRKKEPMIREGYCGQSVERYGGFSAEKGSREFDNLLLLRGTRTFNEGNCPRAAVLYTFQNDVEYGEPKHRQDQAYLVRLVPSNVRASYNTNPAFPKHDHMKLAESVAKHYAEMMKVGLCHTAMHPENILFTGTRYVLTDMADARLCNEVEEFDSFLVEVLSLIEEVPGIPDAAVLHFYNTLRNELDVSQGQK